jgi:hypothetical protein
MAGARIKEAYQKGKAHQAPDAKEKPSEEGNDSQATLKLSANSITNRLR